MSRIVLLVWIVLAAGPAAWGRADSLLGRGPSKSVVGRCWDAVLKEAIQRTNYIRPRYRELRRIKGQHGGELMVLKPTRIPRWDSPAARYGKPIFALRLLDRRTGKFFGYRVLNQEKGIATSPTLAEFMGARAAFNRAVPRQDQMIVGFYPARILRDATQFLRRFVDDLELPGGSGGLAERHDPHYHYIGANIVPSRHIQLAREQARLVLEFEGFLKSRFPQLAKDRKILRELKYQRHKEIDVGLANHVRRGPDHDNIIGLTSGGISPRVYLQGRVRKLLPAKQSQAVELEDALANFLKTKAGDPNLNQGFDWDQDFIQREFDRRLRILQEFGTTLPQ